MLKPVGARFITVAALFAIAASLSSGLVCCSLSDAFAIEVVLNKPNVSYDLSLLAGAERISYMGGEGYAYYSRYDPRLRVILSVQEVHGGRYLGVRVQAPFELEMQKMETVYECNLPPIPSCYHGELRENITIDVRPGEGEITLELGTIRFSTSFVRFKPVLGLSRYDIRLIVNGLLTLEPLLEPLPLPELLPAPRAEIGTAGEYRIPMPCLLSVNEPCFRVMMLIPGYDVPIRVEEGEYRVKLTLSWNSNAQVELLLKQLLVYCDLEVLVQPLEKLGWAIEGRSAVKRVGSATITIDLDSWKCELIVPREAERPQEAELELAKLLESIGLKGVPPGFAHPAVKGSLEVTSPVDESTVKSALRVELEQLIRDGVVKGLDGGDVESIISAAALGNAGFSRRLVWYAGSWIPYEQVPGVQPPERRATFPDFGSEQMPMRVATEQEESRKPSFLPLAIAGTLALATAAAAFVLVKRVFKP